MKKRNVFCRWALALLLILFLALGATQAEELAIFEGELDLFANGGLPESYGAQVYSEAVNSFNSYITAELKKQTEQIDVYSYGMDPETFAAMLQNLVNDSPDLFFVASDYRYSVGSDVVHAYLPHYKYTGEDLQNRIAAFNASVSRIAGYASQSSTTVGKLMIVNDYFCTHFQYDTSYSVYSPDELFSSGKGVCQAYMLGYKAVLDRLGISSTAATSPKTAMNHTWNMVSVGGSWYHVDVTWNDPTSDLPLQARHNHFLLSDTGITASGHYGWTSAVSASSTKYDSVFWQGIYTPLSVVGDQIYYVSQNFTDHERTVMSWSEDAGTKVLLSFSSARSDGVYIKSQGFTPVLCNGDRLFYAGGNNVYSVSLKGGESALEYTAEGNVFIFTASLSGNTMKVYAAPSSDLYAGSIHSFTVGNPISPLLNADRADVLNGEELQLTASIGNAEKPLFLWESDNEAIFTVDETGLITPVAVGAANVTATYAGELSVSCPVIVHSTSALEIPSQTEIVGAEALQNVKAQEISLNSAQVHTISAQAFADCIDLRLVELPESVSSIAEDAFDGCDSVTLVVCQNSAALAFVQEQKLPHVVVPPPAT